MSNPILIKLNKNKSLFIYKRICDKKFDSKLDRP